MSQSDWQFVVVDKNTDSAARVNVSRMERIVLFILRKIGVQTTLNHRRFVKLLDYS